MAVEKVGEKCYVVGKTDEAIVEACRAWDDATEELWDMGLIKLSDYVSLKGIARDGRLELVVDGADRRVDIDVEGGELAYTNGDVRMNEEMRTVWEVVPGVRCIVLDSEEFRGVRCSGVGRGNVRQVAVASAVATSMYERKAGEVDVFVGGPLAEYLGLIEEAREYRRRIGELEDRIKLDVDRVVVDVAGIAAREAFREVGGR